MILRSNEKIDKTIAQYDVLSSPYWWRIVRRWIRIFLVIGVIKGCSFAAYRLDGPDLLSGKAKDDFLERRNYLVQKVIVDDEPLGLFARSLPEQFAGEWRIGAQSMTAAALTNLAILVPETKADAVARLGVLAERMGAPETRRFDTNRWAEDALRSLGAPRGHIGYLGHYLFVLGAHRLAGGGSQFDQRMHEIAESLSRRLQSSPIHLIETYPGEIYIPDNVVVFAALKNTDRALGSSYSKAVDAAIATAREKYLDPQTGVLVFSVATDGTVVQGPRGSGAGWNSFYLPFVDQAFAAEQSTRVIAHFVDSPLGGIISGVREYPRGVSGAGDIDSGPVVLGLSCSGTGFFIAGLRRLGDAAHLRGFMRTAELAGTTISIAGERRYLFAPLVGDAILLAMMTSTDWESIIRRY